MAGRAKVWITGFALALVALWSTEDAHAGDKMRVCVLKIAGTRDDDLKADIVRLIDQPYSILKSSTFFKAATRMRIGKRLTPPNLRRLSKFLRLGAIIDGSLVAKGGRYQLVLKVRDGRTGGVVERIRHTLRKKNLNANEKTRLRRDLISALERIRLDSGAGTSGAGDDDDDDDDDDVAPTREPPQTNPKKNPKTNPKKNPKKNPKTKGDDDDDDDDADDLDDDDDEDVEDAAPKRKSAKQLAAERRAEKRRKAQEAREARRAAAAEKARKAREEREARRKAKAEKAKQAKQERERKRREADEKRRKEREARIAARKAKSASAADDDEEDDLDDEEDDLDDEEDDLDDEESDVEDDEEGAAKANNATKTAAADTDADDEDEDDADEDPLLTKSSKGSDRPSGNPGLVANAGLGAFARTLTFSSDAALMGTEIPVDYEGGFVPSAFVDIEAYPLALTGGSGVTANVGIDARFEQALSLSSTVDPDGGSADNAFDVGTTYRRFGVGLRYRLMVSKAVVGLRVGYGQSAFELDKAAAMGMVDIPNIKYTYLDPGVTVRYPMGKLSLDGAVRFLAMLGAGEIQEDTSYGQATILAADIDAGLDYLLTGSIGVRLGLRLTQMNLSFTGTGALSDRNNDDAQDVDSATDRYVGGYLTGSYRF